MYPKQKFVRGISKIDSLSCYRDGEKIVKDVQEGIISSAEGGFLRGWNEAGIYPEEEEEE